MKNHNVVVLISVIIISLIGAYFSFNKVSDSSDATETVDMSDVVKYPPLYGVAIYQTGGIGSEKLQVIAVTLKALDSEETGDILTPTKDYVGVYFKSTNEMWAYCGKGYGVISVGSSAGNPIYNPSTGTTQFEAGIELLDQLTNTLEIACEKI